MLGGTGFVQNVAAQEPFRRPGDYVNLVIKGSGFTPGLASLLKGGVDGLEKAESVFRFVSSGRLEGSFEIPQEAPEKSYNVTLYQGHEVTYRAKEVFLIVPPNWIEGLDISPQARPGRKSVLKLLGRDFSEDFAKTLRFEMDEPGIHIGQPRRVDASTLVAGIEIDYAVTPGNYMINLKSRGTPIKPHAESVITVGR
jgi:hypothetical protein